MTVLLDTGKYSLAQFGSFLVRPLLARLATAVPSKENPGQFQPHNVPVWYHWDGGNFFISAFQSTRKVKEVIRNPYIALLIDVPEPVNGISAVLAEAKCDLILDRNFVQEYSRMIYTRYMGEEGVLSTDPQSWIVDPENSIIMLTPKKLLIW
jgi:hypothetical protein